MANPFTPFVGSASITASEFFIASGSTTATYQTTAGKLRGLIDLSAMISGDTYQIQRYETVNGGSALPIGAPSFPSGVQSGHFEIPEGWVNEGWEIGVKLINGSARTVGYTLKLDVGDRNLLTWKGLSPAALTTNGYVQTALQRWLTDNAGGTPNALASGRVDAIANAIAASAIDSGQLTNAALVAIAAKVVATVVDANGLANAQTLAQVLAVIVAAVAGPGTPRADDGAVSIKSTDGSKPRIVGSIAAGVRTLTSLDGT